MHYVFKTRDGRYIGTRKETGEGYARRVTLVDSDNARVFNTKAAATNAAKGQLDGEALPVAVVEL